MMKTNGKRMCCSLGGVLAGLLLCAPLAAQEALPRPPEPVLRNLYFLEKQLKIWSLDRIEPLERSVRVSFAKNSWRASLTRPYETAPVEGLPDPLGKRKMKNLAEFILVAKAPGVTARRVRPYLRWKVAPGELYTAIAYLGETTEYFWFGKTDILTLHWVRKHLRLTGGEAEFAGTIAEALNQEDENNFSRKSAVSVLPEYGNAAIPALRKAIGIALADNEPIGLHLLAMKNIGTPEAAQELVRSLRSGNREAYAGLVEALAGPPYLEGAKEVYFRMAAGHDDLPAVIEAAIRFKWEAELLPLLKKLVRRPNSFGELLILKTTIDQFESKRTESPELAAMEQIKILLMRSGDIAGSPRVLSLSDKAVEVRRKLEKEDQRRIQPFEELLVKSENKDMAVVAALALYLADWNPEPAQRSAGPSVISKEYLHRVKETGMRILRRLDAARVQAILKTLKNSVESEEESNMFSSLAVRLGGSYGNGAGR